VTQLSTLYSTSVNPAATSSCVEFVKTSTRPSEGDDEGRWGNWEEWGGDRVSNDDDDDDASEDQGWNGRPDFRNRRRQHKARSERIIRQLRRQDTPNCIVWSTLAATRTEQVIMTRTSWSTISSTEVWTISPKCGASSRTQASIAAVPTTERPIRTISSPATSISTSQAAVAQDSRPSAESTVIAAATSGTALGAGLGAVTTATMTSALTIRPQSTVTDSQSKSSTTEFSQGTGILGSSKAEATAIDTAAVIETISTASDNGRLIDNGTTTTVQTAHRGKDPNRIAGIAAGSIGGVAAALLILAVLVWWRRKRSREQETTLIFASEIATPVPMEKDDYPRSIASHSTVSAIRVGGQQFELTR
jgi:hypothetical protein